VQTNSGKVYRIDPATGTAKVIALANGESVVNGDGSLLSGKTLYVVQNQDNRVAVIALAPSLASGWVVTRLDSPIPSSTCRRPSTGSAGGSTR